MDLFVLTLKGLFILFNFIGLALGLFVLCAYFVFVFISALSQDMDDYG